MSAPDLHAIATSAGIGDPTVGPVRTGGVTPVPGREVYRRILNAISAAHTAGYNAGYAAALASRPEPDETGEGTRWEDGLVALDCPVCGSGPFAGEDRAAALEAIETHSAQWHPGKVVRNNITEATIGKPPTDTATQSETEQ